MGTRRKLLIFILVAAVCLLMGVGAYFLSPAPKAVTNATNGAHETAQSSTLGPPLPMGLSSQNADTGVPPQPQVNPEASPVYRYDAKGQLSAIIYADGSAYIYRYDAHGDKISETTRSRQTWTYLYDKSYKPIATIDPQGNVTRQEASSKSAP